MTTTTEDPARLWRSHGAVELSSRPGVLEVRTPFVGKAAALDEMWLCRQTVKGKGWTFWIEPQNATPDELNYYVPSDFRGRVRYVDP